MPIVRMHCLYICEHSNDQSYHLDNLLSRDIINVLLLKSWVELIALKSLAYSLETDCFLFRETVFFLLLLFLEMITAAWFISSPDLKECFVIYRY